MKPRILVTESITGTPVDELAQRFDVRHEPDAWQSPERLAGLVADCDALLVRNQTPVTAKLLKAASKLRVIGRAGVGLDNIDVKAASAGGIVVVSTPEQNSLSVAELAVGMMFALARNIASSDRHVRGGGWDRRRFTGVELSGKTLGLVGLGRIGFLTGLRARALGMEVIAHDEFVSPDSAAVSETRARLVGLDELLASADFVSAHVPLSNATRGMFGAAQFERMKPTAYFLNLARGELVNESDLHQALMNGRLAGAALDVREQEPPAASPLHQLDNVIFAPHIGAFTREGQSRVVASVCHDVANVLSGATPRYFVNFPRPPESPLAGLQYIE